jgi:hypothetical protein
MLRCILFLCVLAVVCADPWDDVHKLLQSYVDKHAFPGCAASVYDVKAKKMLWSAGLGKYTYGALPPYVYKQGVVPDMTTETIFDMVRSTCCDQI